MSGLEFTAWLEKGRVARLELPRLPAGGCRETGRDVRIDIKVELDDDGKKNLEELAEFLSDTVRGTAPRSRPDVCLSDSTEFASAVMEVVSEIPRGVTRSYGWVARSAGRPGAARAVGNVLSGNQIPLLVPCHRVTRSDGSVGGWSGSPGWKEYLLGIELAPEGKPEAEG